MPDSFPAWVSEAAIQKLCQVQRGIAAEPRCLRFFVSATGELGFDRDSPRPGDHRIELELGELLIDSLSLRRLEGRRLHYRVVDGEGGRFEIERA
ncbi:MAG: hypothetical protein RL885_17685 [Planctomycetota bacterium]